MAKSHSMTVLEIQGCYNVFLYILVASATQPLAQRKEAWMMQASTFLTLGQRETQSTKRAFVSYVTYARRK